MTFSRRYLITLLSNIIRAGLNFLVSISVAKFLMPELYGEYQYILSIFTSILLLMNMGTESAYFTFISQKKQHFKFHLTYFTWQFFQIILVLIFVLSINQNIYELVFKGSDSGLILIALCASFFVGNIQNSINHIIESIRKTHYSQILSIGIAIIHLILILSFINSGSLSIQILFQVLLFEYVLYTIIIFILSKKFNLDICSDDEFNLKDMITRFYIYSKPLFIFMLLAFIYTFLDRWLIQTYIGAEGQAYFSISLQFSALTILITSSILKVFWKEIAESIKENKIEKTKQYFEIVSKNLFLFTTVISTTLFFFSNDILTYFYSDTYLGASIVFKLIMLYPIVQSMGQLYSVFLLGTEQTKLYRNISIVFFILGAFLSIIILSNFAFNLGIEGIAIKLLIVDFLSIILLEYYIMKFLSGDTKYFYKLKYFTIIFIISYFVYEIQMYLNMPFLLQVLFVSIFYILPIGVYLFMSLKKELKASTEV